MEHVLGHPLPPEEPTGQNPPDGAILDYHLPADAGRVALEIVDSAGEVVRRYSSGDPPEVVDPETLPHPTYWIRPPQVPGTSAGHHRFVWDLRYAPPRGARRQFSIAAVFRRTPSGPQGPFAAPGRYTVRLDVDGRLSRRPLEVRLDPRVKATAEDIRRQTELSMRCYRGYQTAQEIREAIDAALEDADATRRATLQALRGEGAAGEPDILYGSIYEASPEEETIVDLQHKLLWVLYVLQGADAAPTAQAEEAVAKLETSLAVLARRWEQLH